MRSRPFLAVVLLAALVRPAVALAQPPAPPPGAMVLAREAGRYGVALAVRGRELTATVLSPRGGGASGLRVSFALPGRSPLRARPCGSGCYRALARTRPRRVVVRVAGAPPVAFAFPARAADATALVRRAGRAVRSLHTFVYRERLASTPKTGIVTLWQEQAPDRLSYRIDNGTQGIVIGTRRWDRQTGTPWRESPQAPLTMPRPAWSEPVVDARVLSRRGHRAVVSFANPSVPAFFTTTIDTRTGLPVELDMVAAAHFMHHDYLRFNAPLSIRPPG